DDAFIGDVDLEEFYKTVDFGSSIRVLVELTHSPLIEGEYLIRIGCAGYLSRDATREEASEAVAAVLAGQLWASWEVVSRVLLNLLRESRHRLTFRESEILALVSEGLKNGEIARRLFIAPETVRWHLRSLYKKLGTHDRFHAVSRAPLDHEVASSRNGQADTS